MTAGGDTGARPEPVILQGIGVSSGVVIGPAHVVASDPGHVIEATVPEDRLDHEIARLEDAIIETRRQLRGIQKDLERRTGVSDASVLDAHLMVLDDRTFIEEVILEIRKNRRNAESVVRDVSGNYAAALSSLEDEYLRERVADINDVARRIIRNLTGRSEAAWGQLRKRHVLVANDLAPSETAALRTDLVLAFVTDLGSATSHTAVMARALEIPAIVALHDVTHSVSNNDELLVDGNKGVLIINPAEEQLAEYGRLREARRTIVEGLRGLRDEPAVTRDGHRVVLSANAEGKADVEAVVQSGAEGIGLFRSEYLYLSSDRIVGEDEQAVVYSDVAERLAPNPVIIRTLDLGGDKVLPAQDHAYEANPFMGLRSIRFSLAHPDEFKSQLRAILRASVHKNVQIMYPMISSVDEVVRANQLLDEAKRELSARGAPFDDGIQVGAMIEIPSAALTAGIIAEKVSFLSIGTNDLIQYTLAIDRINERVAYLYEPTHPAVLQLLKATVDGGHGKGVWVGVCGEMAADPLMVPLLLGLGVDELSVVPSALPLTKDVVRSVSMSQTKNLAEQALSCNSAVDVLSMCRQLIREVAPEILELF